MTHEIDLSYRPETYSPESRTRTQLLSNIKGQARRELAASNLEEGGIKALSNFTGREALTKQQREDWGAIHPWLMGGEFLSDLKAGEVEIARISLKSVTFDQISVRARPEEDYIRLSVEDEYETIFTLDFCTVSQPLNLGGLIIFLDHSNYQEDAYSGGLVMSHWNACFEHDSSISESADFAYIDSAYYPDLGRYYRAQSSRWAKARTREMVEDNCEHTPDDWHGFFRDLHSEWDYDQVAYLDDASLAVLIDKPGVSPHSVERIFSNA